MIPDLCAECLAKVKAAAKAERVRRREKTRTSRLENMAKRAARREATAELRNQVVILAGGRCERCGEETAPVFGHMHHLYGGSGRRKAMESPETCAWLCGTCHRGLHQYPREARAFRETIRAKRAKEST